MQWEKYKNIFIEKALLNEFSASNVESCLKYASKLHKNNVPIVYDINHFSKLVGYDVNYIIRASNGQAYFYRNFTILKKNGKKRKISEPLPSLKFIQRWLLDYVLSNVEVSRFAKAYIKKKSVRDNARFHQNQKNVLSLDIKDFFPSINFNKVYCVFRNLGYRKSLSTLFANLCTLDNCLPQGAPTSPAISNIICKRIDARISGYCTKHRIRYTRYADDMTFSGDLLPGRLINFVSMVLKNNDFKINSEKTRLMGRHQRQEVTGIVVNDGMQIPRDIRRRLRQKKYYIEKYGLESYIDKEKTKKVNHVSHLIGLASFGLFINNKDKDLNNIKTFLYEYS